MFGKYTAVIISSTAKLLCFSFPHAKRELLHSPPRNGKKYLVIRWSDMNENIQMLVIY